MVQESNTTEENKDLKFILVYSVPSISQDHFVTDWGKTRELVSIMEVLNFSFKFCLFFLPDVIFPFVLDQMESISPLFYSDCVAWNNYFIVKGFWQTKYGRKCV